MRSLYFVLLGCLCFFESMSQSRIGGIQVLGRFITTDMLIADVWGYTDANTGKEYALLCATSDGLYVIDVSDPKRPVEVARLTGDDVNAFDVKTWGQYAYLVSGTGAPSGKVIDLANPENPIVVGSFPGGHNIFISDKGYLYLASPGLTILNLNDDPLQPSLVYNDNDCVGHDVSVIGDLLYDFAWNCGTRIFNITQPGNPRLLGTVSAANSAESHSGWPSEDGNFLFVAHEHFSPAEKDISVVDISDLSSPILIGSYADPNATAHNLYVIDDRAYVSYYRAGMRIFDISDPTNIALLSEYDDNANLSGEGFGGIFGLFTEWGANKMLASVEEQGLLVLNFADVSTSTKEYSEAARTSIEIYPNPTSDWMTVTYDSESRQDIEIQITDVLGRVVLEDQDYTSTKKFEKEYSLKDLSEGMYLVSLKTRDSVVSKKVIKGM